MTVSKNVTLLIIAIAASCSNHPDPKPRTVVSLSAGNTVSTATAPSATATISATATTVAAPAASNAPPSPPPPPPPRASPYPGADPDKLTLVQSVCAAAVNHLGGRIQVGCRACAPWDDEETKPDGQIAVDPDPFYSLVQFHEGSFTHPGAQQAALLFDGCENISEEGGGTLIVEKSPTDWYWTPVSYHSGLNPNSSLRIERPERDILVCQAGLSTGYEAIDHVYTYDFKTRRYASLVRMHHHATGVCVRLPDDRVTNGSIERLEAVDINRDGKPDLRVHMRYASATVTKALKAKIKALCDQVPGNSIFKLIDSDQYLKVTQVRLDFLQDGEQFVPTTATRKWLKKFGAETL